ncbi:MAG: polyphosphate glucokinase [Bacteroidetes bacterium]|nr:MAG: polyphosphate glucokinase [Bacteroidota bacterium]PTM11029.1 MAG: polyphosphate glucokinase [Bacteroidota bacterium]
MKNHIVLGVDIGGSGIKGGLIDIKKGEMITERYRLETPQPATPAAVAATFKELIDHFDWKGPVGVGFPAIVRHGKALSASNIDASWIGVDITKLLSKAAGCPVYVLNDADAAGIAAMHYGVGKGEQGVVFMITIGSGIGSALFMDGKLVPNTELGHIYLKNNKEVAEKYISGNARKARGLGWSAWGKQFNKYLLHLERLFSPDLIILGGGGSKQFANFQDKIQLNCRVIPAGLLNQAGAIGAAYYAWEMETTKPKH